MLIPLVSLLSCMLQPATRADTVRVTITAIIAEDSPRTPFLLGVVTGIAIDDAGRVYVSDGGELPTTYPIFRSLSTAHDGTLWARRWSASSQRSESWFDLLDANGRFLRTVVVPADCATQPVPVIRGGVLACLSLDPETDAERVVIARVPVTR